MKKILSLSLLLMIVLLPMLAFAQSAGPVPPSPATQLTGLLGLSMALNVVIGMLAEAQQGGSILGIATTPKSWVPYLSLAFAFFSSAGAYVFAVPAGTSLTSTLVLYAAFAGLAGIISKTSGVTIVNHTRGPRQAPANDNGQKQAA